MQAKADRTFTENARRAQIVRAAIETIGELGYARTSFGQIAKRAGLSSTGMISYHFNGKADLIAEVVKEILDASVVYMGARIEAVEGPAARLSAYIESNLGFMKDNRTEIMVILDILHHKSAGHPDTAGTGDWYGSAVDLVEQQLRIGQRRGDFGEFDARVMAIAIRQAIDGLPTELVARPDTDIDAYAAELVRVFGQATRVV
jgi:AcrR family transcriptional regulator